MPAGKSLPWCFLSLFWDGWLARLSCRKWRRRSERCSAVKWMGTSQPWATYRNPCLILWYHWEYLFKPCVLQVDAYNVIKSDAFCSSQPSMVHWLSSSIFPCLFFRSFVRCPAMVTPNQISLLLAPDLPNPYIFWKLMKIAIQKWIRNTNTKTKTNKKTPRE